MSLDIYATYHVKGRIYEAYAKKNPFTQSITYTVSQIIARVGKRNNPSRIYALTAFDLYKPRQLFLSLTTDFTFTP